MSKIFVQYDKTAATDTQITLVHFNPSILPQSLLNTGTLVDSIPAETTVDGKISSLYINPTTLVMSYKYTDIPLTLEQQYESLRQQIANMQEAINVTLGL